MSREILQNINNAVTKAADIATHPFDTPTQRTLREWQKQENSLSAKQPNGDMLSIFPGNVNPDMTWLGGFLIGIGVGSGVERLVQRRARRSESSNTNNKISNGREKK